MRATTLLLISTLPLAACVTSKDLAGVSASLARVEAVANNANSTGDDLSSALVVARGEIDAVVDLVEDRTEGFIRGIGDAGEGGLIGLAGLIGLHFWRNSTRKKALDSVAKTNHANTDS